MAEYKFLGDDFNGQARGDIGNDIIPIDVSSSDVDITNGEGDSTYGVLIAYDTSGGAKVNIQTLAGYDRTVTISEGDPLRVRVGKVYSSGTTAADIYAIIL